VTISIDSLAVEGNLGAITTLVGTENLSDFPTTYNANLAQLMRMSTSSVDSITTLSNLVSIGTITTGVWGATDVTVANGGTGLSTLTANAVMLGAGTSNVNFVSGLGSSGQFLTSNGAASDPTWQTSAVSLSDSYQWTGEHDWTASTSYQGVAAFYGLLMLGSGSGGTTTLDFSDTAENTASGTVMVLDAAGGVSHLPLSRLLVADATSTAATTASTTLWGWTVDADTFTSGNTGVLQGSAHVALTGVGDATDSIQLVLLFGNTMIATTSTASLLGFTDASGQIDFFATYDGTDVIGSFSFVGNTPNRSEWNDSTLLSFGSSAVTLVAPDMTVDNEFSMLVTPVGITLTMSNVYIEIIH